MNAKMTKLGRKRRAAACEFLNKVAAKAATQGVAVIELKPSGTIVPEDLAALAATRGFHLLRKGNTFTLARHRRPVAC